MNQSIPVSQIVGGAPGVVEVGGSGLQFLGMILTTSTRVPTGSVLSFSSQAAVAAFFGAQSTEAGLATYYFLGFDNSPLKPSALLFTQYPWAAAVNPYLRGGNLAGSTTLAQLQAIAPGALGITINGVTYTSSSINLASATSFSNAATIIAAALGINDATFTAAIAPATASVTASILNNVMTVSAVGSGNLVVGGILSGTGVAAGTQILSQITGTTGGVGTYNVSGANASVSSTTIAETYGIMTVSAESAGTIQVGQIVAGSGVTAGTTVTAGISESGGVGTYVVSPTQTVASEAMTSGAAGVAFDSVSGAFVITGGTPGTPGTIGYATGAIATSLLLTALTGATLSQGAPIATPNAFMSALILISQNWVSFTTTFNPVTADKVAFAAWNSAQLTKFIYWEWAVETANAQPSPTLATAQIIELGYSGTVPVYAPATGAVQAAAGMGMIASINFNQTNGRYNFAFLAQSGLPVEVTNGQIAAQLSAPPGVPGSANGFNYYGDWSSRANEFKFFYPGSITGQFNWLDSYYCAAWLEDQLQVAQMDLFLAVGQIPFTEGGAGIIYDTLANGPVAAALNFGAINTGVPLASNQVASVNARAGLNIAPTLQTQGWYLQVNVPPPAIRATRGPWPVTLWYTDGGSVLTVTINPLAVQ